MLKRNLTNIGATEILDFSIENRKIFKQDFVKNFILRGRFERDSSETIFSKMWILTEEIIFLSNIEKSYTFLKKINILKNQKAEIKLKDGSQFINKNFFQEVCLFSCSQEILFLQKIKILNMEFSIEKIKIKDQTIEIII